MAKDSDHLAGSFASENTGGVLSGLLAEENVFDRRALWRLGSWGAAAVGAVIVAVLADQSSMRWQRDQVASADLARQSQQIQLVAKESQNEARRLASAIETLNDDRDRLYSRVTVLEQSLDSVTGAIARQNTAAAAPPAVAVAPDTAGPRTSEPRATAQDSPPAAAAPPAPAPVPAPVASAATTVVAKKADKPPAEAAAAEPGPAAVASILPGVPKPPITPSTTSLMSSKSLMAPPDPAAAKLIEPEKPKQTEPEKPANAGATPPAKPDAAASASPAADTGSDNAQAAPSSKVAVQRTEFGVDVGGANSVPGLRALWRGLLKSKSNAALTTLSPIIVIKEGSNGLGMQLRLVAGPLSDAAAAAKICAGLIDNQRPCETTVYDGQRLELKAEAQAATTPKPAPAKPVARRRYYSRHVVHEEPVKKQDTPATPPSTLSALFGRR